MTNYWQNYGLESDPFNGEQANASNFLSSQWKQLLELLQHLSQHSNSLLLVTGLSGIGKTTMLQEFVTRANASDGICKIQGDSSIDPDVLRYLLSKHLSLNLPDNRKETFQKLLAVQLKTMLDSEQRYIVVIDDAHLLPERTIAAILAIVTQQPGEQHPLHVVLFGSPQLETTIADITARHLGEGVTHTSKIKPLNQEHTEQYLYHRLSLAGFSGDFPFSREEVDGIYQESGGIPAKVNTAAQTILQERNNSSSKIKAIDFNKVLEYKNWIAAGVGAVVLSGFLAHVVTTHSTEAKPQLADNSAKELILEGDQEQEINLANLDPEENPMVGIFNRQQEISDADLDLSTFDDKPHQKLTSEEEKAVAKEYKELVEKTIKTEASKTETTKPEASKVVVTKPQPAKSKKAVAKPKQAAHMNSYPKEVLSDKYTVDEKKILSVKGTKYALQLMGAYDKRRVEKFVHSVDLDNKVHYFKTKHHGRDWYVATYGEFSTQAKARSAIKTLPRTVQAQKPWVRSYASIHGAIKKA